MEGADDIRDNISLWKNTYFRWLTCLILKYCGATKVDGKKVSVIYALNSVEICDLITDLLTLE